MKNKFAAHDAPEEQIGITLIPKEKIADHNLHQQKYYRNSKNFNNSKLDLYINFVK